MNNPLFNQFFKNLILGKHAFVRSTSVYKRAILTGTLSFLLLFISLIYLLFDLYVNNYGAAPYYFVLVAAAVVSFLLNRWKYYQLAKAVILYSTLGLLYAFGSSNPQYTGNYLNYFPLILASFALYGYKNRIYAIIFSVAAMLTIMMIFYMPIQIIPLVTLKADFTRINFLVDFGISLFATFFIIMFFIKLNYTIENYLRNNELYLSKILQELEASKQRFELAFKGSNAGLYDWDIKADNIYHAPMWKQMLGYDEADLESFAIGDFFDIVHPDDKERLKTSLNNYLRKESHKFVEEVRVKNRDGSYKWILDSGMALWDDDDVPVRMVGSIFDISEIKEAEERIKEQNKMLEKTNSELDKFVYSTSHDLRAPLMSILGLIDLAKVSKGREELNECLDLMSNRIHRLDEFIAEIIDFSRNSRLDVLSEEIDLNNMLEEIVKDLQYMENSDRIKLNLDIDNKFVLLSDKKRIETILKNLLSNAYKYHNVRKEDPFISVSALRINGTARITIEDNGDGIKHETRDRIFDMFYRGSEKSKGSGLGLYIAKEMTEKLKGKIVLESQYGEGSRFTVEIPQ